MRVREAVCLVTWTVVRDRPGNTGELPEVLTKNGGAAGGAAIPEEDHGQVLHGERSTRHEIVFADGGGIVAQAEVDDDTRLFLLEQLLK